MQNDTTTRTRVHAFTQCLRHYVATTAASLRCIVGIHKNTHDTSFFRFVSKYPYELTPTHIADNSSKMMVANHALDIQPFKSNKVICFNQTSSKFVSKVLTLISDLFMCLRRKQFSLSSIIGPPLLSSEPTLSICKNLVAFSSIPVVPNIGRKGNGVVSVSTLEPWITSLLSILNSAEERLECPIQPTEYILRNTMVQESILGSCPPNLLNLISLVIVIQRYVVSLPSIPTFLKPGIVKRPSYIKQRIKTLRLNLTRIQSVEKRPIHSFSPSSPDNLCEDCPEVAYANSLLQSTHLAEPYRCLAGASYSVSPVLAHQDLSSISHLLNGLYHIRIPFVKYPTPINV